MTTRPTIEDVETSALGIDPDYQRVFGVIHVENIVAKFNPASLGIIAVSERGDGTRIVIDGHHRWLACKRVGHTPMRAEVYHNLTRSEEAQMFLELNFGKTVTPANKYKARIMTREPQVLAITAAVEEEGFKLDPTHAARDGTIAGISKLDQIYTNYGIDAIHAVLQVIKMAWPIEDKGRESAMLGGVARFLATYPNTPLEALGRKLGQSTPQEILSARRLYMKELGTGTDAACARAVWHQYNRGRRARLPNLFDR